MFFCLSEDELELDFLPDGEDGIILLVLMTTSHFNLHLFCQEHIAYAIVFVNSSFTMKTKNDTFMRPKECEQKHFL